MNPGTRYTNAEILVRWFRNYLRRLRSLNPGTFALAFACALQPARAGTNLTTTVTQSSGSDWTAAIWKTNGAGVATNPVAGNTYEMVFNGTLIGNGANNTRVRNPVINAVALETFPGDSLTIDTNAEFRAKNITSGASGA